MRGAMSIRNQLTICLAVLAVVVQAPVRAAAGYSPLHAGQVIEQGDAIQSGDGCTELRFTFDGNFYNRLEFRSISGNPACGYPNWDSYNDFEWQGRGTGIHQGQFEPRGYRAARAVMQEDGNFVIYDTEQNPPVPLWATNTHGNPGAYLSVQGDGNLVVYSASNGVLWSLF
jgi:hypothetical protein